jgi:hypothetical protein
MSSLKALEKNKLENLFDMSGGYVLNFSDASMGVFFGDFDIDIHDLKYQGIGTSKAKKLREFWRIEDDHTVGEVTLEMIKLYETYGDTASNKELIEQCKQVAGRLISGKIRIDSLKATIQKFNLQYINKQIQRLEKATETDPDLAIGTSKELIESCCKTILDEFKVSYNEKDIDVTRLTRLTMEQLGLLPKNIAPDSKGSDIIKKILGNLSTISQGMAELRNIYGTGHGKSGTAVGLTPRHARLAVTSASALVHFLFETFEARKQSL